MDELLYTKRSVYRELFNNICADFSIYRLNHKVDCTFEEIEKNLWEYREKTLCMTYDELQKCDDIILEAQTYLIKRKLFKS